MRNISIFSGTSHPALAERICSRLGISPAKCELKKFSNKETNVMIGESVRDVDVYIVQTSAGQVNDNFIEMLIMIAACRTASARKITVVIPCFPYARVQQQLYVNEEQKKPKVVELKTSTELLESHDRLSVLRGDSTQSMNARGRLSSISTSQPNVAVTPLQPKPTNETPKGAQSQYKTWTARSGTLIANMIMAAGADHVITMDLHDPQYVGFFDIPLDNLYSQPLMIKYIQDNIPGYKDAVIVSPDAGGAKRATAIADKLNIDFALIHRERKNTHGGPLNSDMVLVGDVKDRLVIIIDDIADTCRTLTKASKLLVSHGATRMVALITHGILSGDAIQKIEESAIDEVIVSNTVPQREHQAKCSKIKVMDVTAVFAEAIRRVHNGESVSYLVDQVPY
ncbi:phosphoribosyltransferase-like protein [Gorgonomyces haynaldii]|nr:phosphoribosyltransferase-like protein [Gorgonomyces haynaldii]